MFAIRFDLRGSELTDHGELTRSAIEMAEWADSNGCVAVVLSEHHASPDGYLPSPLVLASAIAARTSNVSIMIAAAILPFYDPVRLAEDLNVLDLISNGRVSIVLGLGYRSEEFALYGIDPSTRGAVVEAHLPVLLSALRDGAVDVGGRSGRVTPQGQTPGGLKVLYGGGTIAAAKRAARHGLDFMAQASDPALEAAYRDEAQRCGVEPGSVTMFGTDGVHALFVADDIDEAWVEIGGHLLADATMYAAWNTGDTTTASLSHAVDVAGLRAARGSHRVVSPADARALKETSGYLTLHPLCGGIPPAVAWKYLRRAAAAATAT